MQNVEVIVEVMRWETVGWRRGVSRQAWMMVARGDEAGANEQEGRKKEKRRKKGEMMRQKGWNERRQATNQRSR